MKIYPRLLESQVETRLSEVPVVALVGPRQCGKTTLANRILSHHPDSIRLDLERPSDLAKLADPEFFLSRHRDRLVCIDEVQRRPDLFPVLRALCDETGANGRFLLLGSASRDLLRQSSETLAGRIAYLRLTPFLFSETVGVPLPAQLWRGAFPRSLLAATDEASSAWRESFAQTFLERDLLLWEGFSPGTMRRLWTMLAHENGETANFSRLGGSLGVSDHTVRRYIDLLQGAFMADAVPPFVSNLGKRLVKAPKVYLADTGLAASLLGLRSFEELYAHPGWGRIWEQFVLAQMRGHFPDAEISFYRTSNGTEVDFVLRRRGRTVAVECKASSAPAVTRGNTLALADIRPDRAFVAAPVAASYPLSAEWTVIAPADLPTLFDDTPAT
jgi:hypothetical protein